MTQGRGGGNWLDVTILIVIIVECIILVWEGK